MRLAPWTIPLACCLFAAPVTAQDGTRYAERTPLPVFPPAHTLARAGNPQTVAWWAVPGVSRYETGGSVGGGSLRGNRGGMASPATGPAATGTFGWDFAGFGGRAGRVFLAPSADPAAGPAIGRNYRTDGPCYVPDVFALRPFRRAVIAKKEAVEERKTGGTH